jgi:predicted Zn-dependent protease
VVTENWQMSLKELEEAEASLMKALKQQPDDPALMKMLTQVYQQQINLIQKAHRPQLQRI